MDWPGTFELGCAEVPAEVPASFIVLHGNVVPHSKPFFYNSTCMLNVHTVQYCRLFDQVTDQALLNQAVPRLLPLSLYYMGNVVPHSKTSFYHSMLHVNVDRVQYCRLFGQVNVTAN